MHTNFPFSVEPARGWTPWGILVPFLSLLFVVVPAIGGNELLRHLSALNAKGDPANLQGLALFLIVPFAATGLIVLAWVRWVERRSFASVGLGRAQARQRFLRGLAIGVVTALAVVAAIWAAGGYAAQGYAPAFAAPVSLAHIGVLLLCFIVQAGSEEILFRGWMLSAVARKFNVATGIAFTTAVFALLHFDRQSPWHDVLLSVLFSLFACLWALREGSIWGVMGWHATWNWLLAVGFEVPITGLDSYTPALLVKLVPQGSRYLNGGPVGPEGSLLCLAFFLIASAWLLWRYFSSSGSSSGSPSVQRP